MILFRRTVTVENMETSTLKADHDFLSSFENRYKTLGIGHIQSSAHKKTRHPTQPYNQRLTGISWS